MSRELRRSGLAKRDLMHEMNSLKRAAPLDVWTAKRVKSEIATNHRMLTGGFFRPRSLLDVRLLASPLCSPCFLKGQMETRFGLTEVTPVGVPRQEKVVAVGRVCCESTEGKINRASILLEVRGKCCCCHLCIFIILSF